MKSATLDSNVFRKIASPESFLKDTDYPIYRKIADAISAGSLQAFACETMLNIEAVERLARVGIYSNYEPKYESTVVASSDSRYHGRFSIGPDLDAHPGVSNTLWRHLQDGFNLGIRIRHAPRIGLPRAPRIPANFFEEINDGSFQKKYDKFCDAGHFIETEGWGIAQVKAIAFTAKRPPPWFRALAYIDDEARTRVPHAIAEWADGDAVAAHIGAGSDYFCTLDFGKKAGPNSVLSPSNRKQLSEKYGTVFVTPAELLNETSRK